MIAAEAALSFCWDCGMACRHELHFRHERPANLKFLEHFDMIMSRYIAIIVTIRNGSLESVIKFKFRDKYYYGV